MRALRREPAVPRCDRRRPAFSLVELLVVLALLGVVSGAVLRLLVRQQRFHRDSADLMELRSQLRQASALLASDLRAMSSAGGDIVAMTDSSLDFRFTFGTSVVCTIPASGGKTLVVPPLVLARGNVLTNWLTMPASGDSMLVFDDNTNVNSSADDRWYPLALATAPSASAGACPASSGLTTTADDPSSSYTVTLTAALPTTILVGSPIRFYRRAHYSLYKYKNGRWYLGYCLGTCSTSNPIQAVAGPFNAYAAVGAGTSGIRIAYLDATGVTTTDPKKVARVSIVLRGQTRGGVNLAGGASRRVITDSARIVVALRNRS